MPTAFVTGASGFVGANLARTLVERGWTVRALLRGDAPTLAGVPLERVDGDLFAPHLTGAMRGADAVFHVAARYSLWRRDAADVLRSNVEGTRAVLAAARAAGVPRVVHTSSVAAIGARPDGAPADERFQRPPAELIGVYKQSKYLAEEAVREAVRGGQDVVMVNPSTPLGAYDAKPTPTGEIVVRFLRRRMPAYVDTGLNVVDVRDVAAGHLLAYERGAAGERYILGGEDLTLRALLDRLAALTGIAAPTARIPRGVALVYATVGERLLAPLGIAPDAPVEGVRMAKERMYYTSERARRELGYAPGPITPALAAAIAWFTDHGVASAPPEDGWRSHSSRR